MPFFDYAYGCGPSASTTLSLPINAIPNPVLSNPSTIHPAFPNGCGDPTISLSNRVLSSQHLINLNSENRRCTPFWDNTSQESCHFRDTASKQEKLEVSVDRRRSELASIPWELDCYGKHELDDYGSSPSLTESPTTSSSCPRSAPLLDFDSWESLAEDPIPIESGFNSPPTSYVLGSNPTPHPNHLRPSRSLHLYNPWEKMRNPISACESHIGSTPSPTLSQASVQQHFHTGVYHSYIGQDLQMNTAESIEDPNDDSASAEPYAKLIFRALMSAPEHKMVLKEIYEWFEKNTGKASDATSKGWQNSIRHNLSMNAAFQKKELSGPGGNQSKKINVWALAPEAVAGGVKSTTRYRKQGANKKSNKSAEGAPERVRSGRKGGLAAKRAAKLRKKARDAQVLCKKRSVEPDILDEARRQTRHSPITPLDMTPYAPSRSTFYPCSSPYEPQATFASSHLNFNSPHSLELNPEIPLFLDDNYDTSRPANDFALYESQDLNGNGDAYFTL